MSRGANKLEKQPLTDTQLRISPVVVTDNNVAQELTLQDVLQALNDVLTKNTNQIQKSYDIDTKLDLILEELKEQTRILKKIYQ